jgi:hypothetical protein
MKRHPAAEATVGEGLLQFWREFKCSAGAGSGRSMSAVHFDKNYFVYYKEL